MATPPPPPSSDPSHGPSTSPSPYLTPSPGPARSGRPPRRRSRLAASLVALSLAAGTLVAGAVARPAEAAVTSVGAGSYTTTLPAGKSLPTGCGDISTNPRGALTANAPKGPVPTNDWWSSILFKKTDCAFGEPLLRAPRGVRHLSGWSRHLVHRPPRRSPAPRPASVSTSSATPVTCWSVSPVSNAGRVQVDDWSDWTVSPAWVDGNRTLKATIGHGLPMSYFDVTGGGSAQISTDGPPKVWANTGSMIGFSIRDHDYVAYAPTGRELGGQRRRRSPRHWAARATSRSPFCPPRRPTPTPPGPPWRPRTAATPTRTSPGPRSATATTRAPAR